MLPGHSLRLQAPADATSMSLAASTRAVLRWALAVPDAGDALAAAGVIEASPPPLATNIDSQAIAALVQPGEPLRALATRLAAAQVARLGLRAPPLGDDSAPGPYGIWLAAAVAARDQPALATELARVCPPARGAWDLALRHAVVMPVLASMTAGTTHHAVAQPGTSSADRRAPGALIDALRAASPLTSLLDHPAPGEHDRANDQGEGLTFGSCRALEARRLRLQAKIDS